MAEPQPTPLQAIRMVQQAQERALARIQREHERRSQERPEQATASQHDARIARQKIQAEASDIIHAITERHPLAWAQLFAEQHPEQS